MCRVFFKCFYMSDMSQQVFANTQFTLFLCVTVWVGFGNFKMSAKELNRYFERIKKNI